MVRISKEDSSQMHSAQSLENCLLRIEQLLTAAKRVAAEMERLKTGPISIGNQPSLECAMGCLARWGKACEDAFTAKLLAAGHFQAETAAPPPATRKAEKAKKARKR